MWWALAGGVVIEAVAFSVLVMTTNWELEAEQVSIHSFTTSSNSCASHLTTSDLYRLKCELA